MSHSRRQPPKPLDERGTLEKIAAGDVGKLDDLDLAHIGENAANLLPGAGQALGPLVSGYAGQVEAKREYEKLVQVLGDLKSDAYHSPGLRRKFREWSRRGLDRMGEATVSAGGALGGMALAGMVPVVGPLALVAGLGGGMLGGMAGNKVYSAASPKAEQDATVPMMQIAQMRAAGQAVPAEMTFAALAANLPSTSRTAKKIARRLERLTGTPFLHEAVAKGEEKALRVLMHEFDDGLRAANPAMRDWSFDKTISEQFADRINHGQLSARKLLLPTDPDLCEVPNLPCPAKTGPARTA